MKISVIIPAYNEEKYLLTTITSLHQLLRMPDEIIVVDGSSTDKTVQIAEKAGAKVVVVAHKGIGYARQKGLEAATGDIVAFTDADTTVPKDWLNKVEKYLTLPNISCVYGTFRVPDGWWPYRFYINVLQPIFNQLYFWIGITMAPGQNMAFWREKALQVGGFPIDFKIAEDIEMVRRLKGAGRVIFRQDLVVISSGRRGNEGVGMFTRVFKAFLLYFIFRKANRIGFPDVR